MAGLRLVLILALSALLAACGGGSGGSVSSAGGRDYAMGFTPFPHAGTTAAVDAAYAVIADQGDLIAHHFDDGIPWPEALTDTTDARAYRDLYDPAYLAELDGRVNDSPAGHLRYIAATPLNIGRDGLALQRGATGDQPLTAPWDDYPLDQAEVIQAYTQHCLNLIDQFDPDYFAYAIEANILAAKVPGDWSRFVSLASSVYTALKLAHPDLPVFITLQGDFYHLDPTAQAAAIDLVLPYTDLIAVSSYPYMQQSDPTLVRADLFTALAALAPGKPFAVAETAWPAEDITEVANPTNVRVPASEIAQALYVERLLADAETLDAQFVTWFFTRDFDDFWVSSFQFLPQADEVRIWKDTGLYDGAGNPRMSLAPWSQTLAVPRR